MIRQTSLLRTLIASPRLPHGETNLDLCYVSDSSPSIIAMSMPAVSYPHLLYRNPSGAVLRFLNAAHGDSWAIFEFRAEGTGYTDAELGGRVFHAPFPDHHPPPFALVPRVVASMREWLAGGERRTVVVHCKAGKGRSGTMSCALLISEYGFSAERAMACFTQARMRKGFGEGVSIPSQRRWVRYIEDWTARYGKRYVERRVRVHALHIWGLRLGVRVAVQGFVEDGKVIKTFHTFAKHERREITVGTTPDGSGADVILEPEKPLFLPSSDVNIDFEKRSSKIGALGLAVVTSVAYVWWNAYFEGQGGEKKSGVFEIEWKDMDGIKGTLTKGSQALDRLQVVWSVEPEGEILVEEPARGMGDVASLNKAEGDGSVYHQNGLGVKVVRDDEEEGSVDDLVGEDDTATGRPRPESVTAVAQDAKVITSDTPTVEGGEEP